MCYFSYALPCCHALFVTIRHPFHGTDDPMTIWDTTKNVGVTQELVKYDVCFLSFMLVNDNPTKLLASVELVQAHLN